jgi:hypothetical protein
MSVFLQLGGLAIGIACVVGTALGFLIKLIVEQEDSVTATSDKTLAASIIRALDDIHRGNVVPFARFRDEILRKTRQFA